MSYKYKRFQSYTPFDKIEASMIMESIYFIHHGIGIGSDYYPAQTRTPPNLCENIEK